MTTRRSSATDLGAVLVGALAERDFDRLAGALAADVRMRALIPPGPVELSGAEPAAARFASWFGDANGLELVRSGCDEVGDRLHVSYRLRVKKPGDSWKVIEQHLFCTVDEGRITALDLVCSGFRPDAGGARTKAVLGDSLGENCQPVGARLSTPLGAPMSATPSRASRIPARTGHVYRNSQEDS